MEVVNSGGELAEAYFDSVRENAKKRREIAKYSVMLLICYLKK
jgi:hypothetical protein